MKKLPATVILGVDPGVSGGLALADTKKKGGVLHQYA